MKADVSRPGNCDVSQSGRRDNYASCVIAVSEFVAELKQAVDQLQPDVQAFEAHAERGGPSVELVHVRFRESSGRVREETWQLQYLSGVLGSGDVMVLAAWAARRMLSDTPLLVLNCDWGHEWPLWAPDSEFYAAEPEDVDISAALTSDLRSFYDFWEQHVTPEVGWDAEVNRDRAQREAARLAALLASETEGRFEIENGFRYSSA